ncbi:MAG: SCO family protein [Anaerolineae bacterium]
MSNPVAPPPSHRQSRLVMLGTLLVGIVATFSSFYTHSPTAPIAPSAVGSGAAIIQGQAYTGITNFSSSQPKDFTLTGTSGQPVSLSDFRGKFTIIYFGYINCPDICQATMLNFKQIRQLLGEKADQVNLTFISVDPQRDTPQVIGDYIAKFDPAIIGLAGDLAVFDMIKNNYDLEFLQVPVEGSPSQTEYLISHTSDLFLVDKDGNLTARYLTGIDPQSTATDLLQRIANNSYQ